MRLDKVIMCFVLAGLSISSGCSSDDRNYGSGQVVVPAPEEEEEPALKEGEKIVLAYVSSWSSIIPDPDVLTHINYAFGHVNATYNGVAIDNESRLKAICGLKKVKPSLKVLLSIGGWGSGRFSEMAANESNRESFAIDCKRVVDEFGLDGIDIDWEYPTSTAADISASPQDTKNYNLLMERIRAKIGKGKLLTFASAASAKYYDFKALADIVDYANIMLYDVDLPPCHHAPLYRSDKVKSISAQESVEAHVKAGFPVGRLVLGMPFYGRTSSVLPDFISYGSIAALDNYEEKWDDTAKAPYLADASGAMVCSFDNPRSIVLKCEFIKSNNMLGAMYWEYANDDGGGTLRHAVWNEMKDVIK